MMKIIIGDPRNTDRLLSVYANCYCQIHRLNVLVVAAATENYDNSKDDDPGAVIVEEMAEAVVIHSIFLRCTFAILVAHYILCYIR